MKRGSARQPTTLWVESGILEIASQEAVDEVLEFIPELVQLCPGEGLSIDLNVTRHKVALAAKAVIREEDTITSETSIEVDEALRLLGRFSEWMMETKDMKDLDLERTCALHGLMGLGQESTKEPEEESGEEEASSEPEEPAEARLSPATDAQKMAVLKRAMDVGLKPTTRPRARQLELAEDLEEALASNGLEGYGELLRKVRLISLRALKNFTVKELERALREPGAGGKKFNLPIGAARAFAALCKEEPSKEQENEDGMPRFVDVPPSDDEGEDVLASILEFDSPAPLTRPKPARGPVPGRDAVSQAMDDAPLVRALFGVVEPNEEQVRKALLIVVKALGRDTEPASAADVTDVVDELEVCLQLAQRGGGKEGVSPEALARADRSSARALLRWLSVAVAETTVSRSEPGANRGSPQSEDQAAVVGALLEAQQPAMSSADQKIAEEITASRMRLEAVAAAEDSRKMLKMLAISLQSDSPGEDKMTVYSAAVKKNGEVAKLLHSAHVRDPKGARAAQPFLRETVDAFRDARAGLLAAAREVARKHLPTHADAEMLVESVFKGELASKEGRKFNVRELATPKGSASWLGSKSSESSTAAKTDEKSALVCLLTVMPALIHLMQTLHPKDVQMGGTLTEVMAEIAKGLKTHGVASAVDNVLAPLLREYEEGFQRFQKSAQAELPKIGAVWERVRVSSSVAGFMAQSAVGASGQDAPSFAELQKQCKEAADAAKKAASDLKTEQEKTKRVTKDFNSQLKNLREHVGTDDENDEDGPASGKKKKKKKKKTPAPPSDGEKEE
jgi:hypothetical protein